MTEFEQTLLEAGYKEYPKSQYFHDHADRFYQKRLVRGDRHEDALFLNVYRYDLRDFPQVPHDFSFVANTQIVINRFTVNIEINSVGDRPIEEAEALVLGLFQRRNDLTPEISDLPKVKKYAKKYPAEKVDSNSIRHVRESMALCLKRWGEFIKSLNDHEANIALMHETFDEDLTQVRKTLALAETELEKRRVHAET